MNEMLQLYKAQAYYRSLTALKFSEPGNNTKSVVKVHALLDYIKEITLINDERRY
ncbi:hypothetical protein [Paenibacillus tianjinensis]|uniref:Uncharacterized protein n=1 Tax=Paenibacillus tianjinensis TaxID=2810347 RepID=A0ABX7LDV8_9BACL|nr:hypothetical protein [Paenibacillus tianjinensis]QSF46222.1 hypothetical protein JRJ22_06360 [Paenibacillus tianjinensis]